MAFFESETRAFLYFNFESADYLMKVDFVQTIPRTTVLQATEFLHRLLDRFVLFDIGIHGMFLEIHLLCQR